jgi:hypothetical protein
MRAPFYASDWGRVVVEASDVVVKGPEIPDFQVVVVGTGRNHERRERIPREHVHILGVCLQCYLRLTPIPRVVDTDFLHMHVLFKVCKQTRNSRGRSVKVSGLTLSTHAVANTVASVGLHWISSTLPSCP